MQDLFCAANCSRNTFGSEGPPFDISLDGLSLLVIRPDIRSINKLFFESVFAGGFCTPLEELLLEATSAKKCS